jgi:4-hydroxy-tetrahydrodipicolinate synthase
MIDAFAKEGFDVFSGNELPLVENVLSGGAGCISATANVNPGPIAEVYDKARSAEGVALQKKINDVRETMQGYVMIPALKYVVAHYGADPAWVTVRPPLLDLPVAEGKALVAKLEALGFSMPGLRTTMRQAAE